MAAATCWVSSLSAQAGAPVKDERVWTLEGLRAGYCVRFLISPKDAGERANDRVVPLRADQDETLHPALRNVIESQPEFAEWIPSSLCFYYTDAIQLPGQRVVEKDRRKAQMLGIWSLAAVDKAAGSRRNFVLDLLASRERLREIAARNLVQLHEADASFRAATDTSGDEYSQQIGKARLVWNGRVVGKSTRVEQPIVESWLAPGVRGVTWFAQLSFRPAWSQQLVGSFKVEGKGDLAKLLRASPIRFVGPFYRGGGGELRLSR